jgi:hypothetical protein
MASIAQHPEDRAARAALAKKLAGDPRGTFIQLQLDAATELQSHGRSETYKDLRSRYRALEQQHGASWAGDVAKLAEQPMFARGFVEYVTMSAAAFLAKAGELYKVAPIRGVTLVDFKSSVRQLAASPYLDRLVALQFYDKAKTGKLDDADAALLAGSPHLARLQSLDVSFNAITNAGVDALCALAGLRYLNLAGNPADNPVEQVATDTMSGDPIATGTLPERGRQLEAKYGKRAWLHAPSELPDFPPTIEAF